MIKFRTMVTDADAMKDSLRVATRREEGLFKIPLRPAHDADGALSADHSAR